MSQNKSKDYDAGNERDVGRKKTRGQLEHQRQLDELSTVMESPGGRYLIWRILKQCGVYDPAPFEYLERFEGRRDVGMKLIDWMFEAKPASVGLMQLEALRREEDNA